MDTDWSIIDLIQYPPYPHKEKVKARLRLSVAESWVPSLMAANNETRGTAGYLLPRSSAFCRPISIKPGRGRTRSFYGGLSGSNRQDAIAAINRHKLGARERGRARRHAAVPHRPSEGRGRGGAAWRLTL
ncbi:hypothetical protein J6590_044178 [Homalodisca vitripennis]|nr:hypothetical protein J6590_044178 [Homalodisca vitripennis]